MLKTISILFVLILKLDWFKEKIPATENLPQQAGANTIVAQPSKDPEVSS